MWALNVGSGSQLLHINSWIPKVCGSSLKFQSSLQWRSHFRRATYRITMVFPWQKCDNAGHRAMVCVTLKSQEPTFTVHYSRVYLAVAGLGVALNLSF